jgi:DNA-binding NtrC family response regulator
MLDSPQPVPDDFRPANRSAKVLWLADTCATQDLWRVLPAGWSGEKADSVGEAVFQHREKQSTFLACLVYLPLQDSQPSEILETLLRYFPRVPVIFVRWGGAAAEAVQLLKLGAFHYFDQIPDQAALSVVLSTIPRSQEVADEHSQPAWRRKLIGSSPAMQNVADVVGLIAGRRSTVLILGETGSGKEMVARAIHQASPRADRQMVTINCAAIPENLLEAELFGHVKGAFTGATGARMGRFEQAEGGTLFLDEIGDLPFDLQAKLLRVLQEREFTRVGSSETIHVDVRVIAATNIDLMNQVKQGKFREDLYYRLNVVPLRIPALRDRPTDIPGLVHHFVQKVCLSEHLPLKSVSADTLQRLTRHPWPGNVRQLENAVEMAVVLSGNRTVLVTSDFALLAEEARKPVTLSRDHAVALPEEGIDFESVIGQIEINLLEQALRRANGNKSLAAEILGLKRTTLAAKLKSLEPFASR